MAQRRTRRPSRAQKARTSNIPAGAPDALKPRGKAETDRMDSLVHILGPGIVCDTDRRGHATPGGKTPAKIVVDASEGFVPLWSSEVTLRWRFRERSFDYFEDPQAAKAEIRDLFAEALLAWGTAAPVTFTNDDDLWDFEIVMRNSDECNPFGCVLAGAFFPDAGRHELELYPKMFTQTREEQVETLIHEVGHVFGLRHFFANVSETAWPSEIFGRHHKFSIMNYGTLSELTEVDKEDLTLLYQAVWSGELTHINGTPIRLVKPYSSQAPVLGSTVAIPIAAAMRPKPTGSTRPRPQSRSRAPMSQSKAPYLDVPAKR